MNSLNDILKLAKYEKPPAGFTDDFVAEFHRRQRVQQVEKNSTRSVTGQGLWSQISSWYNELNFANWSYGAYTCGLAYALFMAWLLIAPPSDQAAREEPVTISYPSVQAFSTSPIVENSSIQAAEVKDKKQENKQNPDMAPSAPF